MTQQVMKVFSDGFGGLNYEVIVEVHNQGSDAAGIGSGSNDYTIYYKDGSVLATGSFTYSFPQVLPGGAYGYYVDSGSFDAGTKQNVVGKFDPSVQYGETTCDPGSFAVTKVRVGQESYGSGLKASGVVTNNGTADATQLIVGFIFFDSAAVPIGALYDNTGDALPAGSTKGVTTSYPGTPPLKPATVKTFKAIAYDFQYSC